MSTPPADADDGVPLNGRASPLGTDRDDVVDSGLDECRFGGQAGAGKR